MKTHLEVKNIIIAVLIITLSLVSFDPLGIMPNRTITMHDTIGYEITVHDTIPQEIEVEVEVPIVVEKQIPYAVHDTIQALVDTNFIVNQYLNSKNIFTNTYKFDKQQGSITIIDTISNNKLIGRKYTTKITPRIDTLKIPEPFKRKVYAGIESSFSKPDVVGSIGLGFLINSKSNKIYQLGLGVNNRVTDGTNGQLTPYIKGGVYWKIKLKK